MAENTQSQGSTRPTDSPPTQDDFIEQQMQQAQDEAAETAHSVMGQVNTPGSFQDAIEDVLEAQEAAMKHSRGQRR
jgi:hypothetical protein